MRRQAQITHVLVLALAIGAVTTGLLTSDVPASAPPSLLGVMWQWVKLQSGTQVTDIPIPTYTLQFTSTGTLNLNIDCNDGDGTYAILGNSLSITDIWTTLVGCLPHADLDEEFLDDLYQATSYSLSDGNLLLNLPNSSILIFSPQPHLTGSVSYFPLVTLPPNSRVVVEIRDVTNIDQPFPVADQFIDATQVQAPFAFDIAYPANLSPNDRYRVSAAIEDSSGDQIFATEKPLPVITDSNPTSNIQLRMIQVQGK